MPEITLEDARADYTAHAALFVLVMTALIVLNVSFLTGWWWWWSVIPLVGWGVVLARQYLHLRRVERAAADRRARPGSSRTEGGLSVIPRRWR
jgi:hypothetical protein